MRSELPKDLDKVRNIFLHPRVLENYSLKRGRPDPNGIMEFLCEERAFKRDRIQKVAKRLTESQSESDSQLVKWLA